MTYLALLTIFQLFHGIPDIAVIDDSVPFEDGDLKSTTPDGQSVVNTYSSGTVQFNTRNRAHQETLVRGRQHAIITELKVVIDLPLKKSAQRVALGRTLLST